MEFNNSYIATLKEVFTITYPPPNRTLVESVSLDNNSIISHYMELEGVNNNLELPTFLKRRFELYIQRYSINNENTTTFVAPLIQGDYSSIATTVSIMLKYGFRYKSYNSDIVRFITKDNEIYYIGKGLILNSEFKPLLYCTLSCNMEGNRWIYANPKVYLDPTVFINSDTVSKHIIKKMIPCYVSIDSLGEISDSSYTSFLSKPEIIIKDLSNIIKKTNNPSSISITGEAHNLLNNHVAELMENLACL